MATPNRCKFCDKLSFKLLVKLAKEELGGHHSFPQHAFYHHQPSLDDLELAAENGCDLCALILRCFLGSLVDDRDIRPLDWPEGWKGHDCDPGASMYAWVKRLDSSSIGIAISSDHLYTGQNSLPPDSQFDTLLIQVGPRSDDFESSGMYWELPPLPLRLSVPPLGEALHVDGYRIGRFQLVPDLSAPENFEIARGWLQTCRDEHRNCLTNDAHVLPTRVVDVGVESEFHDLRIAPSRGARDHYVALSHCWGGPISPLLTTETIESFGRSLPYEDLPANFQDAITITRSLGFRYLWIDSLCIVQDSKQDWEVESLKMADIYRHSVLTISALSSPGSKSGIFARNPRPVPSLDPVPYPGEVNLDGVFVSSQAMESEYLNVLTLKCPLYSRGWCLQEMVLSPRHLFYGEQQIYWRCPRGFRDAEGTGPAPGRRFPEDFYEGLASVLYSDMMDPLRVHPRTEYDVNTLLTEYYRLVGDYSQRKLTYGSDKLPAFSGIAQRLHPVIGGDYLAGLWSKDIHRGLFWSAEMGDTKHARPSRAPSWSWAVTDQSVLFDTTAEQVQSAGPNNPLSLQLLSHDLSLDKPHGEIVSGSLVVRGLTRPMKRSKQVVDAGAAKHNLGRVEFDDNRWASAEAGVEQASYSLFPTVDNGLLVVITPDGTNEDWDVDQGTICPKHYIVLLIHVEVDAEDEWTEDLGSCLVLRQRDVEGDETYERVGVVKMNSVRAAWLRSWEVQTITLV